ncbi:MAG: prenyltransferase/squalene oxidase repeat-containing protein [Thermoguttaceae bacterium]
MDIKRLRGAYTKSRAALLNRRAEEGHWVGTLSSSPLSTATAVSALAVYWREHSKEKEEGFQTTERALEIRRLVKLGVNWLIERQNRDGGWGDTPESPSNPSTTQLVKCAFLLSKEVDPSNVESFESEEQSDSSARTPLGPHFRSPHHDSVVVGWSMDVLTRADFFLRRSGGIQGIQSRYGRDKTFYVPIMMNTALAGLVSWKEVPALPFEWACFPQSVFHWLKLPVVSYAIPALVAIGRTIHHHHPSRNVLLRKIRGWAQDRTLKKVEQMQPESGGFLEATPLTSFVIMGLAASGLGSHTVVEKGVQFLIDSARNDGSWPIDTNLATWVSTLSVNALTARGFDSLESEEEEVLADQQFLDWIIACQHREPHPFTGAKPGGWAWTPLSGGVPDCDDTPGALLALSVFEQYRRRKTGTQSGVTSSERKDATSEQTEPTSEQAVVLGLRWLLGLQNRDGGWPTFSRGWNRFPFDRSSVDLTAHAIRSLLAWRTLLRGSGRDPETLIPRMEIAIRNGVQFLLTSQEADGCWLPLWFGNQHHAREDNPLYGTAKVLKALEQLRECGDLCRSKQKRIETAIIMGLRFVVENQNSDGGFGCRNHLTPKVGGDPLRRMKSSLKTHSHFHPQSHSSVEETALVLDALTPFLQEECFLGEVPELTGLYETAVHWLIEQVETDRFVLSAPIGLYFTKLWYDEKLYPIIFTVSALGQALSVAEK